MKTTKCNNCNVEINNRGFAQHRKACNGTGPATKFIKLSGCPHCAINLNIFEIANRANHVRWCIKNPKRQLYVESAHCTQMHTAESVTKRITGIKKAWADGKYDEVNHSYPGWKHTEKTKQHLREKALASPHRRLVRSIREYTQKNGTIVKLDSSWEEALAIRLDSINVEWARPAPIKWVDKKNITHNYFPDFYLPEYDLYLDPKNPYAIKAQQSKIDCLTNQIKNLIIIKSLTECNNFTPDQCSIKEYI
jgi:hypothetical protein